MDRPVTIGNVHNMSLESLNSDKNDEYPHLVAQFSCDAEVHECISFYSYMGSDFSVCCAAFWLHDMYNVTVKGISITVQTSNEPSSGIILNNGSDITVQLTTTCSVPNQKSTGIAIHDSTSVEVHSSSANNCSSGLVCLHATNTHINKVTAMYNEIVGILSLYGTYIHINNTTIAHNTHFAMYLSNMNNTYIINTTTTYNDQNGMDLSNMNNIYIKNVSIAHNHQSGLIMINTRLVFITNLTTTHNTFHGMASSNMNDTHITNATAAHNRWNGMDLSNMNNTYITNTTTTNNTHGMHLSNMNNTYITNMTTTYNKWSGLQSSNMNNTHITNVTTVYNIENGMVLFNMRYTRITNTAITQNNLIGMYLKDMNNTNITKITAAHNGYITFPRGETCCGQITILSSTHTLIYNTSFSHIYSPSAASTADPTSLPAVIVLYGSTLHVSGCEFTGNNISAVKALASNITVSGNLTFSSNRALAGTAFIFVYDSVLTVAQNSHIYFLHNQATNFGGVFYIAYNRMHPVAWDLFPVIINVMQYYSRSTCFLNTEGRISQTSFTFVNNSAVKGGDILYGGQLAYGLDGAQNCLDSFRNTSNISQSGLSLISSDPLRVCLCNGTGQPDCLVVIDPTPHTVYPGQTINISAVVVGQDFGTVSGSAYAQFLQRGSPPQLEPGQKIQGVTQHKCHHLYYTIFSWNEVSEAVLTLTAHDSYVSDIEHYDIDSGTLNMWLLPYRISAPDALGPFVYTKNPVYVNISLLPCPPGFMLTTHTPFRCDCNSLLQQMHGIKCHIQEQTIGRSGLLWVGMIQDDNGTNGTVAASEYCPLDYCNKKESNVTLNEPDSQCNYNHSGTLCGGCQPGLSLALGGAQCMQCSNNYLALLIPLTLAGPILVFSIKVLDLTISHGTLNGLIFYANIVKANEYIFLPQGKTNPLTVFIAWLNLDLGVETCLFQGLTAYSKTWLQFVFPFYIWTIAGLIIIIAKYSDRVAKVMGNNSVPVLATLFLLSYAKLLRTIITALTYTMVYTSHGPKAVWTADGNVDYLGPQHAPLFATAVAVLLFLWLPYTLLLFLGQWLHRCNCRLVVRLLMKIKPFLDAHYGPLKGKHRYWFGTLLLVRAAILLISALIPANRSSIIVLCISVTAVVLTYFGQLVYCNLAVAMFDIASFMNLALMTGAYSFTTTAGGNLSLSVYTLIGVASAQFVGLVFFKVFSILRRSEKVNRCFCKGQPVDNDWELYEQAALQRGRESDAEEQDSDSSESVESLPTY